MRSGSLTIDLTSYPWQPPVKAEHRAYIVQSGGFSIEPHTLFLTLSPAEPHEMMIELRYYGDQHQELLQGLRKALEEVEFHSRRPQTRHLMG